MRKITLLVLMLLVITVSCSKSNDENNNNNSEDLAFYNSVISLQDKAAANYTTWSQSMDSIEAIT